MDTLVRFLFDFLTIFFNGIKTIALGIFNGFKEIFNIPNYIKVIHEYDGEMTGGMLIIQIISIILFVVLLIVITILIIWLIKRLFVFRKRRTRRKRGESRDLTLDIKCLKIILI